MKQFRLTRQLIYGMKGEDVKLMQKLLNIANDIDQFYPEGRLPEDGNFDMFRTRICLARFQDWIQVAKTYCYDHATHGMLIAAANEVLRLRNTPPQLLYTK